jgi:hypothetical protein
MVTLAQCIERYEAAMRTTGREVGPFCRRGHERAIHERRYPAVGRAPTRRCLACASEGARRLGELDALTATPPVDQERRRAWVAFCVALPLSLAQIRAQEGIDSSRGDVWQTLGPARRGRDTDVRRAS